MKRNQTQSPHRIINLSETNIVVFLITLLFFFPFADAQTFRYNNSPSPQGDNQDDSFYLETHFKFSPVLGIVLFCLVTAFFVMGFISVYARQCIEGRFWNRSNPSIYEGNGYTRRAYATGIDPVLIDTFPTFMYSDVKGHKIGKGALECAVCLNEFEDGETLRLLPKCCHVFHPHCIDAWLAFHVTCPVCRANLIPVPGEKSDSENVLDRDSVNESTHSTRSPDDQSVHQVGDVRELVIDIGVGSQEVVSASKTTNQNRSLGLTPENSKVKPRLSRSHSTGHSMVQSNQDPERFTLRLTEEVQKKFMQPGLKRAESHMAFPSASSSRKGFRSNSFGSGRDKTNYQIYYERFNRRPDRRGLTNTPPFLSRTASSTSLTDGEGSNKLTKSGNLLKSAKSPFHRLFGATANDDVGKGRLLG